MRSFWLWFSLLVVAWMGSFLHISPEADELIWPMLLSASFFAAFFLSPIFRDKPVALTIVLGAASLLAAGALWPWMGQPLNPYPLLVFSLLAGKAVYRLPPVYASIIGFLVLAGATAPALAGYPSFPLLFTGLYAVVFAIGMIVFSTLATNYEDTTARSEALLSEYRKLKRRHISDEEAARQEARAQVGRDIHDSVGHKLTALLMQLEVYRMQSDDETKNKLEVLKALAKESLEETRSAVRTLKQQEIGGLQAILGLIRRLEAESFIRIQFTVKDGALSAPLSNSQSIAVYRVIQEALTNAMRHSNVREAEIMFEAPGGGSVLRFEVVNRQKDNKPFMEGFGLQSMRERMEQAGGQLELVAYDSHFIVRGTLSMLNKGEEEA
ncbi:MAG: sensor histidine kinase [Paenibacillus sp.]|jgi:signal transduction histidine kinase|nr:sensor histidine kinase [Paenibacillus sp.]